MAHGQSGVFTFPNDLSGFTREVQTMLTMAHDLGWSVRWLGVQKHVAEITSPNREKSINVPTTNINANRMKSWVGAIRRYSDPEKVEQWADEHTRPKKPTFTPPIPPTTVAAAMAEARASHSVTKEETVTQPALPTDYVSADVTVVSEKPWLARSSGVPGGKGTKYESPFVLERLWSDGHVDYKCPTCDYSSDRPRSVSSHASLREDHPKGPQSKKQRRIPVKNYEASGEKHPNRAAVSRLATELLAALDGMENWHSLSPEELARRVAERIYAERPERESPPDLTSEQIIERISFLVDGGRYFEMHQQVERAAAALREASERAETAERDVVRLREERRVLAEMLREEERA